MASNTLSPGSPPPSSSSAAGDPTGSPRNMIALHVLCPSLPPPNRFTLHDLPLSTTIASLKARISQSIPSRPPPETQRLIYGGKPLSNDGITLQSILEPVDQLEYSMHLVLPPAPIPAPKSTTSSNSTTPTPTQDGTGAPTRRDHLLSSSLFNLPNFHPNDQGVRYRRPAPTPSAPNEAEIEMELRHNIESIRRHIDAQRRGASPLRPGAQETATTTSSSPFTSNQSPSLPQQGEWQRIFSSSRQPSLTPSTSTSSFMMPSDAMFRGSNAASHFPEILQSRLQVLRQDIEREEDLLRQGIAPPINQIIRIRTQLFQLLDDQYRNPGAPRDATVELLLTRILNIYTRADQIRVSQPTRAPSQNNNSSPGANDENPGAPLYLLSSPDGYQGLVTPPGGAEPIQSPLAALRAAQIPGAIPMHGPGHPPNAHQNPNAAAIENAVRQAVINNNNRRQGQLGLARSVRRIWLFVRLYFFCYMFSEPGTWTRIFFVTLAVVVSLLSETGVPQHLHRILVAPVQQHLEGLVHFAPDIRPRTQGTQTATGQNVANPPAGADDGRRGGFPAELRHNFRRVERSLALFFASLVPGVGERHIEVRNAAEAAINAERAREEEEHRQQETRNEGGAEGGGENPHPEPIPQHDD